MDIFEDRLKAAGDRFYADLMAAHRDLTFEESARLNARLVLLMANAIGDGKTLRALLDRATADRNG